MPTANHPSQRIPSTFLANQSQTSTKTKKAVTPPAKNKTPLDRMIDRAQIQHIACRRVFHRIAREDTDGSSHESP
jgi:hypothetical protein